MKKITLLILFFLCFFIEKPFAQQTPPADTLAWLQTNIGQNSSFYIGKPFSVLMDTLMAHGINITSMDYLRAEISDGALYSMQPDTVWTAGFSFFFKPFYLGIYSNQHNLNPNVNTNVPYIALSFTQKIPFPKTLNNMYTGNILGPVISIVRPYIIASIEIDTW